MKKYETTFVLDAGIDQVVIDNEVNNVEQIITSNGGKVLDVEKWVVRRFAYELKKRHQGSYIHVKFEGSKDIPDRLARQYRINENILRYLTVVSQDVGGLVGALREQKQADDNFAEDIAAVVKKPSVGSDGINNSGGDDLDIKSDGDNLL